MSVNYLKCQYLTCRDGVVEQNDAIRPLFLGGQSTLPATDKH